MGRTKAPITTGVPWSVTSTAPSSFKFPLSSVIPSASPGGLPGGMNQTFIPEISEPLIITPFTVQLLYITVHIYSGVREY